MNNKYNYDDTYIAVLEIPKINLKRGLYSSDSPLNDVDHELAFIPGTDQINDNSNTVIVGHSGNSPYAYFNDLNKLEINDDIYLYYQNTKYIFKVSNIYIVPKTGSIDVYKEEDIMTLTLVTCYLDKYQLVIIANKKDL